MTATLDASKVWAALTADPKFSAGLPADTHPVFKELVEALPDRLGDLTDRPLTLESFAAAKLVVLKASLEIGFVKKMVEKLPEEALAFMDREDMGEMLQETLTQLVPIFEGIVVNAVGWLSEQGINEATFLAHPRGGRLGVPAMTAYDDGTLTVRTLLEIQPMAVIQNTDG
jgi:hypothetical protein